MTYNSANEIVVAVTTNVIINLIFRAYRRRKYPISLALFHRFIPVAVNKLYEDTFSFKWFCFAFTALSAVIEKRVRCIEFTTP